MPPRSRFRFGGGTQLLRSGTFAAPVRFRKVIEFFELGLMRHPWPLSETSPESPAFEGALDIAMEYLEQTGQALNYVYISRLAARTIEREWYRGVRHKIALANAAIVVVESETGGQFTIFPRAS